MSKFTFVELFAGIGGVSYGFEAVGGRCLMAAEFDPKVKGRQLTQESYKLLHPHVEVRGDVTMIDAADVPNHDVLSFTSPCQSFSVAGLRKGFDDTRGTLTFEALRIAKEKRPKALFMENVKGLVNHDKGNTLSTILHAMNEIGYTVDFHVLNSKYFEVPHQRERVFIIGIRDDLIVSEPWGDIKGTLMIPKTKRRLQTEGIRSFNFAYPEQAEVKAKLRDILEPEVDEKYYLSDERLSKLVANLRDREVDVLSTRNADDVNAFINPNITVKNMNGTRVKINDDPMHALTTSDIHGVVVGIPIREATKKGYAVAEEGDAVNLMFPDSKTRRGRVGKQIANTLEASGINQGVVEFDYRIRELTPRECLRLQSFPEGTYETLSAAGISDSQIYKQSGNAVTVNVIKALGERLLPYLNVQDAEKGGA